MKHFTEVDPRTPVHYNTPELKARRPLGVTPMFGLAINMGGDLIQKMGEVRKKVETVMMDCHSMFIFPYFRHEGKWYRSINGAGTGQIIEDFGSGVNVEIVYPVSYRAMKKLEKYVAKTEGLAKIKFAEDTTWARYSYVFSIGMNTHRLQIYSSYTRESGLKDVVYDIEAARMTDLLRLFADSGYYNEVQAKCVEDAGRSREDGIYSPEGKYYKY